MWVWHCRRRRGERRKGANRDPKGGRGGFPNVLMVFQGVSRMYRHKPPIEVLLIQPFSFFA